MKEESKRVAKKLTDELIGHDFGLYSGKGRKWAKLLFSKLQAPWIKSETWHAEQRSAFSANGEYLLSVPYSDPRELILEIMRFGPDVCVLEPIELRTEIAKRLRAAADQYPEQIGPNGTKH